MMICEQIALALSVLGAVGVGVIFTLGGVRIFRGQLHFRNIRWRLFWLASWLSFLVGIAISALLCGSPANDVCVGDWPDIGARLTVR